MPQTPEWHALRRYDPGRDRPIVFGATAAAAALNLSKYGSALGLYLAARGEADEPDLSENAAVQAGRFLEAGILRWYEHRDLQPGEALIASPPSYFHPTLPFMGCTPDALVVSRDSQWLRGVDAKTTTFRRYDEFDPSDDQFGIEGTDQLPLDYLLQAQQQIAVLGVAEVVFPVLFDIRTLRVYRAQRHDGLIDAIIRAEQELAERIANADPPEPNWSLPGTGRLIREVYGCDETITVQLDEESEETLALWSNSKKTIAMLEQVAEINRNKLLWQMGDAVAASFPSGRRIKRTHVKETKWTQADIDQAVTLLGRTKRRGYETLREVK
jgi:predicted phage-related endonuclease